MPLQGRRGHRPADAGRRPPDRGGARARRASRSTPEDLDTLLTIDIERWRQEMGFREAHLEQFDRLPEEIWEAHRRVAAALDAEA